MPKLKGWAEPVRKGTNAILAPTFTKELCNRTKVIWLLCRPPNSKSSFKLNSQNDGVTKEDPIEQSIPLEEGEIILDGGGEGGEVGEPEQLDLSQYDTTWAKMIDSAVQFNRFANYHYGEERLLVEVYVSDPELRFSPPRPDVSIEPNNVSSWSKLNLFNLEPLEETYTLETILDQLGSELGSAVDGAGATSDCTQVIFQSSIILLMVANLDNELWFEDAYGNDLRLMFDEQLKRSRLTNSLHHGSVKPIQITLLKACSGEGMQMGDAREEMVGPWIRFLGRYLDVQTIAEELANFSVDYLNLGVVTLHGLPYRCKDEVAPGNGISILIRGGGCGHPRSPCDTPGLELQFCAERDTRIGQLDSTCAHNACILDPLDSRARALEKALFEGYIFVFRPTWGGREPAEESLEGTATLAPRYTHILRLISGKVYLFCLRQVRQLPMETSVEPTDSFAEYFRLNILRPNLLTGKPEELPGFGLSNPSDARTLRGSPVTLPTGMASHHAKIPASSMVTAETCWLSRILSTAVGDALYRDKVLASSRIQSIKRLFMSEAGASASQLNKLLDELCPLNQEKLAYNSDSLSTIHQQMFLSGLAELIPLWPQVWPNPRLKDFLRDARASVKNRLSLVLERRAVGVPMGCPPPPLPSKGWPVPFPPHPNMMATFSRPIPPPFPPAPGFRPYVNPWGHPTARDLVPPTHAYLKPDPYAERSLELQDQWQSQLGDSTNLLYHYWMGRKDESIPLQPHYQRQQSDFDAKLPPTRE